MNKKQIQYIRENNLFGLNDTLTYEEHWNDLELIQSEIITNLLNTVQYYWIDKNDYSKNRVLVDYILENNASEVLANIGNLEKYNIDNYIDSMMLIAKDIYDKIKY